MNLLIVDDEIYIVRALQKNINWKMLGIDQTFIAFNAEKAKEIIGGQKIDILITDIEMPRESGLDLLEWVRNEHYECKAICLTCHGEFRYAQRAMQYQVSDYILKPVDFQKLESLIAKTAGEVLEERKRKEERNKGILWEYHQGRLETAFWKDVLCGISDNNLDVLARKAEKVNIEWDFNQQYQLVLFSLKRVYKKEKEWNENVELMQYIIYNISRDTFLEKQDSDKAGWIDAVHMWAIIPVERSIFLQDKLEKFIELCYQIAGVGIVAYLDEICFGEELHLSYQRLMDDDRENVSQERGVFDIVSHNREQIQDNGFYRKLRGLLKAKNFREAEALADTIWNENCYMSSRSLILNVSAGQYEIYRCLEENRIPGEKFWNNELVDMIDKANHSASIYKDWLKLSVKQVENLCGLAKEETKVIAQIRQFVLSHIEERISREDIAKHVSFSTDYISKLFKKETGISLSEYIMEQKIQRAKELIEGGEDSIGNIAVLLGYNSFSYFSEVFRRFAGVLPSEYKRNNKTE